MLVIIVKTTTLLGAAIFTGTCLAPALLGARQLPRVLRCILFASGVAVVTASVLEIGLNLQQLLGSVSWGRFVAYVSATRHGNSVAARTAFVLVLMAAAAIPKLRLLRWPSAIGVLATFSYASHAAAMGGAWPLVTDLLHFVSAAVWASAVLYARLAPIWLPGESRDRVDVLARLSRVGLLTVALLSVSGVISTLVHSSDPESFTASPYAKAWIVKVIIVVMTVTLAAWNRFVLLPRARRDALDVRMRQSLTLEFVLLTAVFVATAWLTTSALPHSTGDLSTSPIENLTRWFEYIKE